MEHRCFALAPDPTQITRMFGSAEAGKTEIMSHWAAAAAHPDGEVINTELMRSCAHSGVQRPVVDLRRCV